ncbi:hypothetical protein [Streptomyces sp. SLBN-31]|uniref:hypothetical protein n=1 Tax=Streptomyces sp. SLBN-31 TaxID=2768444 RepID=UPI001153398B|nr:hypothetical protein [Streptomyces sp. SLBN-31]
MVGDGLDFTALARRRGRDRGGGPPIVYLVFDCLAITGTDRRPRPLQERLDQLGELLRPPPSGRPRHSAPWAGSRPSTYAWSQCKVRCMRGVDR